MIKRYTKIAMTGILMIQACYLTLTSCDIHKGSESQLKDDIDSFATYYYNWHFEQAAAYCTPESKRWLKFAASNVHQADIDSLRAKATDALVEVDDVVFHDDDTTATVAIHVKNFLQMDSIGQVAHPVSEATFQLPMVLRHDKWWIHLKSLPRKDSPQQSEN